MTAGNTLAEMMADVGTTEFTGYGGLEAQGRIVALLRDGKPVEEAEEGRCLVPHTLKTSSLTSSFFHPVPRKSAVMLGGC